MIYHYTDRDGYNAIVAQPVWQFLAAQPPGDPADHPFGAYFTDYPPGTKNLARRLGIPRRKLEWGFVIGGGADLLALPNVRGEHIFYSPVDYLVPRGPRQVNHGSTGL